jgi:hypothetical protein
MSLVGGSNGRTYEDDYAVELTQGKRKIIERGYINWRLCTKVCNHSFERTIKMRTNLCEARPGIPLKPNMLPENQKNMLGNFSCGTVRKGVKRGKV